MKIVFVCQAGDLEHKAILFAASIRATLGYGVHLVAACPQPVDVWGELRPSVQAALRTLDVETLPVRNPFGRAYPIANKIEALARAGNRPALLVDSDILCLSQPPLDLFAGQVDVAAKPADGLSFNPGDDHWALMYRARGLEPPRRRVLTTVSEQLTSPYFNAGVVYAKDGHALGGRWMEVCCEIHRAAAEKRKLYWLDQIALPIAIEDLRWIFKSLTERWNYPAEFKLLENNFSHLPFLAHYHRPKTIWVSDTLRTHVANLLESYPWLGNVIDDSCGPWHQLVSECHSAYDPSSTDAHYIITGLPSSGTALLGAMLSHQSNSLIVDAPDSVTKHASWHYFSKVVKRFHAEWRCDHMSREPAQGALTVVTADRKIDRADVPFSPFPQAASVTAIGRGPRVMLGTISTFTYMARLKALVNGANRLEAFVCVRDPRATISAWMRELRHFAAGDIGAIQGLIPPQTLDQARELNRIAHVNDVRIRRAMLWRYLTSIVSDNEAQVMVIRYEDMVTTPDETLRGALRKLGRTPDQVNSVAPLVSSHTLEDPSVEDSLEERMIADICGAQAELYGYIL